MVFVFLFIASLNIMISRPVRLTVSWSGSHLFLLSVLLPWGIDLRKTLVPFMSENVAYVLL